MALGVSFRFIAAVIAVGALGLQALAREPGGEGECVGVAANVDVWLELAPADDEVRVTYRASQPLSTFALGLPRHESLLQRLRIEGPEAEIDGDGSVVLSEPSQTLVMNVPPDPPGYKMDKQYPIAFAVAGRGTGVFLPFLLPQVCGDVTASVRGGPGVAAIVDGAFRWVEEDYRITETAGFVLVGKSLDPGAVMQFARQTPAWLEEAIRDSYQRAQQGLVDVLAVTAIPAPLFVDVLVEGAAPGQPRSGGDKAGESCGVRLWFRGEDWADERPDLLSRTHDLLVHELAHCYQPEPWQPWAHEGHARFLEKLVATGASGDYVPGTAAEAAFVQDFDTCMNELRVSERRISPYSCGSVAYWLRWLQTGRVNMLVEEDTDNPIENGTVAARFVLRTIDEVGVVDFIRAAGVEVDVEDGVTESAAMVRSRLLWTLLNQGCGDGRRGFWTNDASVTLDAATCPDLDRFELDTVAGSHIFDDAQRSYQSAAESCAKEGRVSLMGVDGKEERWIHCNTNHRWPSTVRAKYRLIAPFARPPDDA